MPDRCLCSHCSEGRGGKEGSNLLEKVSICSVAGGMLRGNRCGKRALRESAVDLYTCIQVYSGYIRKKR
jgi:hypothetical protein